MLTCPVCGGPGRRLWVDRGRARFLRCWTCLGEGTVCWMMGLQACPPMSGHLVVNSVRALKQGRAFLRRQGL
jgi:uncharacterized protein YbaR (Trm112 family)